MMERTNFRVERSDFGMERSDLERSNRKPIAQTKGKGSAGVAV